MFLEETGLPCWLVPIDITKNAQFEDESLKISPNNKIAAIVDRAPLCDGEPLSIFESGKIRPQCRSVGRPACLGTRPTDSPRGDLAQSVVSATLLGARTLTQLEDNLGALAVRLNDSAVRPARVG